MQNLERGRIRSVLIQSVCRVSHAFCGLVLYESDDSVLCKAGGGLLNKKPDVSVSAVAVAISKAAPEISEPERRGT